jgi:hypothetical protein
MDPIIPIAVLSLIVLAALYLLDRASLARYQALEARLHAVEESKRPGRYLSNSEKVSLENLIALQLNLSELVDAMEENVDATKLQAERARDRAEKTYQMLHYLRGLDRTTPTEKPDLTNHKLQ